MEQLSLFPQEENLKKTFSWNLWHGCHKISPGCQHCYVYRSDNRYGKDSSHVEKTSSFDLPLRKKRNGEYFIPSGSMVYTCFTSDFFVEEADAWRKEAWAMMRERKDVDFFFITKRIHRFLDCIPDDWGDGYDNVRIGCTVENQKMAEFRMPIFKELPIKVKTLACEPLLEEIDLRPWLGPWLHLLIAGGESGQNVRPCHYDWILSLRQQCMDAGVAFTFKQTGAYFIREGKGYHIPRKLQHTQAKKANIDWKPSKEGLLW